MRTWLLGLSSVFLFPIVMSAQTPQAFSPGWYIVEPTAEYSVLQLAVSEMSTDSAANVAAYEAASIRPGEVVLAFEQGTGTFLVFEWFGRLSAIRGDNALTPAPSEGRPGYVTQDIQFLDRILQAGAAVWVTGIDAGSEQATIVLDGNRTENVPSSKVTVLMNAYDQVLRTAQYKKAM